MSWDRKFLLGFAIAVHDLIRYHDQPTLAVSLMYGHGISLKDFEAAVDPDDLKVIRRAWRADAGPRRDMKRKLDELMRGSKRADRSEKKT